MRFPVTRSFMHRLPVLCAVGGLLLLGGCKTALTVDIYLNDLLSVPANPDTVATAPAKLGVALSDAASCKRSPDALLGLLEGYFQSPALLSCDPTDDGALLSLQVLLPVYPTAEEWAVTDGPVFGIHPQPIEGRIQIGILYNDAAMGRLTEALEAEYGVPITLDNPTLGLRLHNDSSDLKIAQLSSSFINGEPVLNFQRFLVLPDDPVEVVIGTVKIAYMKQNGFVPVVQVLTFDEDVPLPPFEQQG